ncbi:type II toxin-antitoxin system VapC family toxin [Candidatus Micrarchaeota archaeon]|nr:type II toxin-antitoxin system VapC family toxin [Candidatus Micrarchaeota archaeon]
MLIFDTSAAIEWLKGNEKLKNKIENIDIPAFRWYISVITVYELLWAAEKKSRMHVNAVERFIENVNTLPITTQIAKESANIKNMCMKKGYQFTMADLMIMSTARLNNAKLVTFDKDFKKLKKIYNFELIML